MIGDNRNAVYSSNLCVEDLLFYILYPDFCFEIQNWVWEKFRLTKNYPPSQDLQQHYFTSPPTAHPVMFQWGSHRPQHTSSLHLPRSWLESKLMKWRLLNIWVWLDQDQFQYFRSSVEDRTPDPQKIVQYCRSFYSFLGLSQHFLDVLV